MKWSAPCSQVDVFTLCQCPTPATRAPVKPASRSHWSCPLKTLSPMGPTQPPPWRKAHPRLGKLVFLFFFIFPPCSCLYRLMLIITYLCVYPLLHISPFFFALQLLCSFFCPTAHHAAVVFSVADIRPGEFMCIAAA